MQQIINFVIRNKTVLLFMLLFGLSLIFTIQSHSYHRSKFINSANFLTGGIYGAANGIGAYFDLKKQNDILQAENNYLRSLLYQKEIEIEDSLKVDSINSTIYNFVPAKVYKNSYSSKNNYITINRGTSQGIQQDQGVITSKGIVGIVENTSSNYASVISILNSKSRINAQLKRTNHIGSLVWNAKSPYFCQLIDISKFAPVKQGDTIVTGGQSTIFPQGVPIGIISKFILDPNGDTYTINVELFNDMTNLGHVYVIENLHSEEIRQLQETTVDE
ncbi:rod shape-determining protein MreC [Aegicerativicinus sediminis]|uniref:rod shape-determining protein MreC n=1 Tax=Aegicerativicinus sediminis TaxID=2893202 RepID=UPI001E642C82|nr:rod shape-determining protein MreC [Aegicerativicinus sediminis]